MTRQDYRIIRSFHKTRRIPISSLSCIKYNRFQRTMESKIELWSHWEIKGIKFIKGNESWVMNAFPWFSHACRAIHSSNSTSPAGSKATEWGRTRVGPFHSAWNTLPSCVCLLVPRDGLLFSMNGHNEAHRCRYVMVLWFLPA